MLSIVTIVFEATFFSIVNKNQQMAINNATTRFRRIRSFQTSGRVRKVKNLLSFLGELESGLVKIYRFNVSLREVKRMPESVNEYPIVIFSAAPSSHLD